MRTRRTFGPSVVAILALLLAGLPAPADEGPAAESGASPHVLGLGLKAGVGLPQVGSGMDTTFQVRLEATYLLGAIGSRLGLYAALGYSQPEASGEAPDVRLPGGTYSWSLTQRQTSLDLGLTGRILDWQSDFNLVILAGAQILFLSTLTSGQAGGEPFGEHDEQATLPGVFAGLQAEYRLGPGALFAELAFSATFQDLETTGELTASSLGLLVGYRFAFEL